MDVSRLVKEWRELGPLAWAEHRYGWLLETGEPIRVEPWQRAALSAWWKHREAVTTLAISNVKKTGKTTANAILTAWRWLALPGEHFCAGNDLDQSVARQFGMIAKMVERHPLLKQHVKSTRTLLTFEPSASTLEALAADYAGAAGANHLSVSHTECWAILYEAGIRLFEELTPVPGVFYDLPCLRICDSYAGWEGESATWHALVDRGLAGERLPGDWPIYLSGALMLFHIEGEEAQRRCFRGTPGQREAYYSDQRASLRAGTFARLHLNLRASGESQFVDLALWDALVKAECRPVIPGDMRPLWLGADAGTKRDSVALVGCSWNSQARRPELAYVREWRPELLPKLAGGVDLDETIAAEILRLHKEHIVREVRCDPWQMASIMNRLQKAGVNVVEMPQSAQRTEADQALCDAITSGTLATFASPALREAIRKAAAKETPRGFRLQKRPGDDLVVALSMAHFGALRGGNVPPPAGAIVDIDPAVYRFTQEQEQQAAIRRALGRRPLPFRRHRLFRR